MMTSSSTDLRFAPQLAPLNEQSLDVVPADDLHERVDIARRLRAEVHVIRMLGHIESETRHAARQRVAMVCRPRVEELAVARRPRQQHPAGAAAEGFAHGHELGSPTLEGSEIAR